MPELITITADVTRPVMEMIVFPIIKVLYYSDETEIHKVVGTGIWTVAYPLATVNSLEDGGVNVYSKSDMFSGRITKYYPEGRDRGLLSWPCYETDMEVKSGASGDPVCISGSSGVVFAVNCTGTTPHSVSHVSSLVPLVSIVGKSGADSN